MHGLIISDKLMAQFTQAKKNQDESGMLKAIDSLRERGNDSIADELEEEYTLMCKFCFDTKIVSYGESIEDIIFAKCPHCKLID